MGNSISNGGEAVPGWHVLPWYTAYDFDGPISCTTWCAERGLAGTCNADRMNEVTDQSKFEYLLEISGILQSEVPGICDDDVAESGDPFTPGILFTSGGSRGARRTSSRLPHPEPAGRRLDDLEVDSAICRFSDGASSDCDAEPTFEEGYFRFCCCGDDIDCPLEPYVEETCSFAEITDFSCTTEGGIPCEDVVASDTEDCTSVAVGLFYEITNTGPSPMTFNSAFIRAEFGPNPDDGDPNDDDNNYYYGGELEADDDFFMNRHQSDRYPDTTFDIMGQVMNGQAIAPNGVIDEIKVFTDLNFCDSTSLDSIFIASLSNGMGSCNLVDIETINTHHKNCEISLDITCTAGGMDCMMFQNQGNALPDCTPVNVTFAYALDNTGDVDVYGGYDWYRSEMLPDYSGPSTSTNSPYLTVGTSTATLSGLTTHMVDFCDAASSIEASTSLNPRQGSDIRCGEEATYDLDLQTIPCSLDVSVSCENTVTGADCNKVVPPQNCAEVLVLYTFNITNNGQTNLVLTNTQIEAELDGVAYYTGPVLNATLSPGQTETVTQTEMVDFCKEGEHTYSVTAVATKTNGDTITTCTDTVEDDFNTVDVPCDIGINDIDCRIYGSSCESYSPQADCAPFNATIEFTYFNTGASIGEVPTEVSDASITITSPGPFASVSDNLATFTVLSMDSNTLSRTYEINLCSEDTITATAVSTKGMQANGVMCTAPEYSDVFEIDGIDCSVSVSITCTREGGADCTDTTPTLPGCPDETVTYEYTFANMGSTNIYSTAASSSLFGDVSPSTGGAVMALPRFVPVSGLLVGQTASVIRNETLNFCSAGSTINTVSVTSEQVVTLDECNATATNSITYNMIECEVGVSITCTRDDGSDCEGGEPLADCANETVTFNTTYSNEGSTDVEFSTPTNLTILAGGSPQTITTTKVVNYCEEGNHTMTEVAQGTQGAGVQCDDTATYTFTTSFVPCDVDVAITCKRPDGRKCTNTKPLADCADETVTYKYTYTNNGATNATLSEAYNLTLPLELESGTSATFEETEVVNYCEENTHSSATAIAKAVQGNDIECTSEPQTLSFATSLVPCDVDFVITCTRPDGRKCTNTAPLSDCADETVTYKYTYTNNGATNATLTEAYDLTVPLELESGTSATFEEPEVVNYCEENTHSVSATAEAELGNGNACPSDTQTLSFDTSNVPCEVGVAITCETAAGTDCLQAAQPEDCTPVDVTYSITFTNEGPVDLTLTVAQLSNDDGINSLLGQLPSLFLPGGVATITETDSIDFCEIGSYVTSIIAEAENQVELSCVSQDEYTFSTDAPPPSNSSSSCFSGDTTVEVQGRGTAMMSDLQVGDRVLVGNEGKKPIHETVYAFGHHDQKTPTEYLRLHTSSSKEDGPLEVSPAHLVYKEGKHHPVRADSILPGDALKTAKATTATVTKVEKVMKAGAYMPLTASGSLVVNQVHVSAYVSIMDDAPEMVPKYLSVISEDQLLHLWLSPYRLVCLSISPKLCGNGKHSLNEDGISYWLLFGRSIARALNGLGWISQYLGFCVLGLIMAGFMVVEAMVSFLGVTAALLLLVASQWPFGKRNNVGLKMKME